MISKDIQKRNKQIVDRISRIEGQVRGIKKMITESKDCVDIITQINAVREAISRLGVELLKDDFVCRSKLGKKIDEDYLKTLFKVK